MRASPPIDIALGRSGPWLVFVVAVTLSSVAVVATWLMLGMGASASSPGLPAAAVAALVLLLASRAFLAARVPGGRLRWDGRRWALTDSARGDAEGLVGGVTIALDLGGWLLLRFVADSAPGVAVRWLPLQRRGHESDWHALRCALHSGPAETDPA
jgi:hypothetical protein